MGTGDYSPQVNDAFLIHNSGRLIVYTNAQGTDEHDFDVVAGMLAGIQTFVRDAFGAGQWSLKRLEFEDRNLLIELGDHIYLAVIYNGRADAKLQSKVERTVDVIEEKYWLQCKDWSGDVGEFEGVKEVVRLLFAADDGIVEELPDNRKKCDLCGSVNEEQDEICPICGYNASLYV